MKADLEREEAQRLINFTFRGAPQDYNWFLAQPYWLEKYAVKPAKTSAEATVELPDVDEDELPESRKSRPTLSRTSSTKGAFLRPRNSTILPIAGVRRKTLFFRVLPELAKLGWRSDLDSHSSDPMTGKQPDPGFVWFSFTPHSPMRISCADGAQMEMEGCV